MSCARVTSPLPLLVAECHIGEPFNTVIPLDTVITKKDVVAGRDECTVAECGDVVSLIVCVCACVVCMHVCMYVCIVCVWMCVR